MKASRAKSRVTGLQGEKPKALSGIFWNRRYKKEALKTILVGEC